MSKGQLDGVVAYIRRLMGAPRGDHTDGELLDRFATRHDQDAFAALVSRHGPMVLGVCRRVLHDHHDAEDAFQATFLILVRKSTSLNQNRPLGNWLYTVALNTACKARESAERRRRHEAAAGIVGEKSPVSDELIKAELRTVIDEELEHLPTKYRQPLVLCYLQGKTNEAAAQELGWTKGTVSGRLARARDLLRGRLTRRGIAISGAAGVSLIEPAVARAVVSGGLLTATIQAAASYATGTQPGNISAKVTLLVQGVLHAMFMTKIKIAATALLAMAAVGVGAGSLTYQVLALEQKGGGASEAAGNQQREEQPKKLAQEAGPADLAKSLQADDVDVRRQAAASLAGLGPEAQPALIALIYALRDEDPQVRREAATALGNLGPEAKTAVPVLLGAMKDSNEAVRLQVATALSRIGTSGNQRSQFVIDLGDLGKRALPILMRLLSQANKDDPQSMAELIRAIGKLGPDAKASVPLLLKMLQEKTWARYDAFNALKSIGPGAADAVPTLLATLNQEVKRLKEGNGRLPQDDDTRALGLQSIVGCISALAAIDPKVLDPKLLLYLVKNAVDQQIQFVAAQVLASLKPGLHLDMGGNTKEFVSTLLKGADLKDAAPILGTLGPAAREAIPYLVANLDNDDSETRYAAFLALKQIDPDGSRRLTVKREILPKSLKSKEDLVQYARARRDAARRECEAREKQLLAGIGTQAFYCDSARRLLDSELALDSAKAKREAAYLDYFNRMNKLDEIARLKFEQGKTGVQDLAQADYYRIDAEIMLAQERMKK